METPIQRSAILRGTAIAPLIAGAAASADPPIGCLGDPNGDGQPMYGTYAIVIAPCLQEKDCGWAVALAHGDLDGDGEPELVGVKDAETPFGGLFVLKGLGEGRFDFPSQWFNLAGTNTTDAAIADVDFDGDNDLLVTDRLNGVVRLFLNNGGGGLATGPLVAVGSGPRSILVADFNQDGRADLLTHNSGSADVSVVLSANQPGSPTFLPEQRIKCGAYSWAGPFQGMHPGPTGAIGDFNGDGWPDAAIVGANAAKLLMNTGPAGGGTLAIGAGLPFPGAKAINQVVAADFDGDGHLDLAAASMASPEIAVWMNTGTGAFGPGELLDTSTEYTPPGQSGYYSLAIGAGDLDGDGRPDLVTNFFRSFGSSPETVILRNLGQAPPLPRFGEKQARILASDGASFGSWGVRCLDINGDGLDDVISIMEDSAESRVFAGLSVPGHPVDAPVRNIGKYYENGYAEGLATAQLDGSGGLDTVQSSSDKIAIHINQNGLFSGPGVNYRVMPGVSADQRGVGVASVYKPGSRDVVVADHVKSWPPVPGVLGILLETSPGFYGDGYQVHLGEAWANDVQPTDLDGDGLDEILIRADDYTPSGPPPAAKRMLMVVGLDATGIPVVRQTLVMSLESNNGAGIGGVATGDLDGDGDLDAAATCSTTGFYAPFVLRIFNNSGGSLELGPTIMVPTESRCVAMVDADDDGDLDLFIGHDTKWGSTPSDAWLSLVENQGGGQFKLIRVYESPIHSLNGRKLFPVASGRPGVVRLVGRFYDPMVIDHSMAHGVENVWTPSAFSSDIALLPRADGGVDLLTTEKTFNTLGVLRDRRCNPPGSCPPDCDASGQLNIDDFICFQTHFVIGDLKADCDANGQLNIDDFICFQTSFVLGC